MQDRIVSRNDTLEQYNQAIPMSMSDLPAHEQAEYAAWSDQQNEHTQDPKPYSLEYRNGQELVVVDGVTIGRIFTIRDDDVWSTMWTHSEAPKRDGSLLGTYWLDRDKCILDLVSRHHKQLAKQQMVQFADGSTGYAAPSDVDFINWIIERNRGGY